ncbi:MAG: flagellar motor protein [Gammaproteobacteria bacterium SG8_47]|nr:MAG: flagellar motor protein [Gammaproteobacteria bacterium SG8_47]
MDSLSLIGLLLGVSAILVGQYLEGGHIGTLVNGPAALIVIGGTFGAVMLQSPLPVFLRGMQAVRYIFAPPKLAPQAAIDKIVRWSNIARKEGLLGLENIEAGEQDPFIRKGLQLLVDGSEPESIRSILEVDVYNKEHFDMQAAKVFEGMGGFSPTIGIIGAVMGLIHVMGNLSDPGKLGSGIAVAFVATIYGVGAANLLFIPAANKLKQIFRSQAQYREMIVEGMVSIAEGENPRNIETKLLGYLH